MSTKLKRLLFIQVSHCKIELGCEHEHLFRSLNRNRTDRCSTQRVQTATFPLLPNSSSGQFSPGTMRIGLISLCDAAQSPEHCKRGPSITAACPPWSSHTLRGVMSLVLSKFLLKLWLRLSGGGKGHSEKHTVMCKRHHSF